MLTWSQTYLSIIDLVVSRLFVFGAYRQTDMEKNEQSVLLFVVVLFTAGGIAFFHGYEYLEKEKINVQGFPKADLQNMVSIIAP